MSTPRFGSPSCDMPRCPSCGKGGFGSHEAVARHMGQPTSGCSSWFDNLPSVSTKICLAGIVITTTLRPLAMDLEAWIKTINGLATTRKCLTGHRKSSNPIQSNFFQVPRRRLAVGPLSSIDLMRTNSARTGHQISIILLHPEAIGNLGRGFFAQA